MVTHNLNVSTYSSKRKDVSAMLKNCKTQRPLLGTMLPPKGCQSCIKFSPFVQMRVKSGFCVAGADQWKCFCFLMMLMVNSSPEVVNKVKIVKQNLKN